MRKDLFLKTLDQTGKELFSIKDLRRLFPKDYYLKQSLQRFKKEGIITTVTKGYYMLSSRPISHEQAATLLYYPSYISFESALSKYGVINQGYNKLTLATTRHSKKISLMGIECEYCQIKKELFFGFQLLGNIYIADQEKAYLDLLYLIALGKRKVDISEWNIDKFNQKKIHQFGKKFSPKVRKLAEGHRGTVLL